MLWHLQLFDIERGGVWIIVCDKHKQELDYEYDIPANDETDTLCILCVAEKKLGRPANLGDLTVVSPLGRYRRQDME